MKSSSEADSTVRPAATVAVLRDGSSGLETLFILRSSNLEFVPRAQVFPGGRIDDDDASPLWDKLSDVSQVTATETMGVATAAGFPSRAFMVGAIREVFEETGVLLGVDPHGLSKLSRHREALRRGRVEFSRLIEESGLHLGLGGLVPFARRITPKGPHKRYDTFFFAASAPPDAHAEAAPDEVSSLEWVRPMVALSRADTERAYILPPTRTALMILDGCPTVSAQMADLRQSRGTLDPLDGAPLRRGVFRPVNPQRSSPEGTHR